jgi:hypothetical protein
VSTLDVRYLGQSGVRGDVDTSTLGLATSALRPQGYLRAHLTHVERAREVLGTLHGVVVSDLRRKPKDRAAWTRWLAEQDRLFLTNLKAKSGSARVELEQIEARLSVLDDRRAVRRQPFVAARRKYADYVVHHSSELYWLFDPVVTVHPDEVFFEAFSQDESSYARVGIDRSLLRDEGEVVFGTTNIDFSRALARHLERLRSYRATTLSIGPGGVDVAVGDVVHREQKIPLPESWVNGFLQVQATMTMALTQLTLRPIELHAVLRALFSKKARTSPKAVRFELVPGKRIRVVLEPWEQTIELTTTYAGEREQVIRIWGRERLKLLSRLLPLATSVRVELAGFGLPSFWVVDLGGLSFTLGLSGWTDNDWTGANQKGGEDARFELLTRRLDGTADEVMRVYTALREPRVADDVAIAGATGLTVEKTRSALSLLAQAGRATYDLRLRRYRHRDLFFDAFTMEEAKRVTKASATTGSSPQAKAAQQIFDGDGVRIIAHRPTPQDAERPGYKLSGSVKGLHGEQVRPQLHVDADGNIISGSCTCRHHSEHGLTKGPCEHLLALRLAHMERLS